MDLTDLRRHWEHFGREDPLWAVITGPGTRHGQWNPQAFFYSGEVELERVMDRVRKAIPSSRSIQGRALDFGCGVGRASQALCSYFDVVDAVDISEPMLEHARTYNRYPDRCRFHLNDSPDLRLFDDATFDFVYTAHVLQHMEPRYAEAYVAEFLRVARPGGLVVFQITTEPVVGATAPLPESAFHALVKPEKKIRVLAPCQSTTLGVSVRNLGDVPWPAIGSADGWFLVTLGNHWTTDGQRVVSDDGRCRLPRDVQPGETVSCDLTITAPPAAGQYELELDLVQEGVGWFGDRGSQISTTPLRVRRPRLDRLRDSFQRGDVETPEADHEPIMEMYGTPQHTVEEWIVDAGGEVLSSFDWDAIPDEASTDWHRVAFVAARRER